MHDERDAGRDVITAGREHRGPSLQPGRLIRLLVIAEAAALAASVAVAWHYRAEVQRPQHGGRSAEARSLSALPQMTSTAIRLPADGSISGTVLIVAAAGPGSARAQFVVSAAITKGQPDTIYALYGNDCSAAAPLPDHVWAIGVTDAAGAAELTGHAWTGGAADMYWLAIDPSPVSIPPGLHGEFGRGMAVPFAARRPPCAP